MLGEDEECEDERAFNNAPVWKRLLTVLAGPFVNIIFGLFLFWILASIYNKNIYHGLLVTKNYILILFKSIASLFGGGVKEVRTCWSCWTFIYNSKYKWNI